MTTQSNSGITSNTSNTSNPAFITSLGVVDRYVEATGKTRHEAYVYLFAMAWAMQSIEERTFILDDIKDLARQRAESERAEVTSHAYDQVRNTKGQVQTCAKCDETLDVSNVCANHTFSTMLCDSHCECND